MALLQKITIKQGQVMTLSSAGLPSYAVCGYVILKEDMIIENSYHKILNINTNTKDDVFTCSFNLGIFESKENEKPISIENYTCNIDKSGDNYIKQAYEYLNTLDEFKDARDC